MATPIYNIGAIFRVTLIGKFNGTADVINVFEVINTDTDGLTLQQAWDDCQGFAGAVALLAAQALNVNMEFLGARVAELDGDWASGFYPFTNPIPGDLSNGAVPEGAAALMSFPTGVKRVIPRKYFGVLDNSMVSALGFLTSTCVGYFEDVGDLLMVPWEGTYASWEYGYNSPKTLGFERPLGYSISTVPAYQRRRRRGTGS